MNIEIIPVLPLEANCIMIPNQNNEIAIIDPGGEAKKLLKIINDKKYNPKLILLTHGHFDHMGAAKELMNKYMLPLYIHKDDYELMKSSSETSLAFNMGSIEIPDEVKFYEENEVIPFGNITIKVIHTPGHTKGGVCLYIPEYKLAATGDTLFKLSIGRSDLPGGDEAELTNSIINKLFRLEENTLVIPGHGETTTIEYEKRNNPYI